MKRELKSQLKGKGVYNTRKVYNEIEEDMKEDLRKLKDNNRRVITYKTFRKVIGLYFKFVVKEILNGNSFSLYNKFGELRIAKRRMDRYLPSNIRRVRRVEGGYESIKVNPMEYVNKFGWFWHYLNWNTPKNLRTHEFKIGKDLMTNMMRKVEGGFDYIDYTPLYKGEGSIRKIK